MIFLVDRLSKNRNQWNKLFYFNFNNYYDTMFIVVSLIYIMVIGLLEIILLGFLDYIDSSYIPMILHGNQICVILTIVGYFIYIYYSDSYIDDSKMNKRTIFLSLTLLGLLIVACHTLGFFSLRLLYPTPLSFMTFLVGLGILVATTIVILFLLLIFVIVASIIYKLIPRTTNDDNQHQKDKKSYQTFNNNKDNTITPS